MYLAQARRAMASNLPPQAQAAATIALAEGVWRLTELMVDRNRLLAPMVTAVQDPRWDDLPLARWTPEGKRACGMVRDQTGARVCGAAAGHELSGDPHQWVPA